MSANKHERSDENAQISVSMPKALRDRIKAAAELERRALSPWLVLQLEKLLDARDAPAPSDPPTPEKQKQPTRELKANSRNAKTTGSAVSERR